MMPRRRSFKRALLLLTLITSASGCYRATFYRDPQVVKGDEHERWTDFFIFGLVGQESFDVRTFCPTGQVAQVQTGGNFGTGIVGALTLGIYTPRKVYVTCALAASPPVAPSALSLEIDADAAGRVVRVRRHDGRGAVNLSLLADGAQSWRVSQNNAAVAR